jgi:hypothetical protein
LGGATVTSNRTYKFSVSDTGSYVANFKDIVPPKVRILSPTANEKIGTVGFPIQGTASDKVAIEAVYYNLNGAGWIEASNLNHFSNWYAWITLIPNSANTVSVYAIDSSGNSNTPVTTKFVCTAAGFAPLSIAGYQTGVTEGTNTVNSDIMSFDLAGYVKFSVLTNEGGAVGTYTYTPTGPDTAELVEHRLFPSQDTSADATVLELTFTTAYDATYTGAYGGGILRFGLAADIVPETLDAANMVARSYVTSNFLSKNSFGSSTFTWSDNSGESSSGTYTFTKFSSVGALIVETVTNPASLVGTTNYISLSFTTGGSPATGYYNFQTIGVTNNVDDGTFALTPGTDNTEFVGPVTLSGLRGVVTPTGAPSFTRTYGNGTFASLSLKSVNEPTDVGINLANPRVSANTGTDQFFGLGPPYIFGLDDETTDATFTSPDTAEYVDQSDSSRKGTITFSKLTPTVAPAVTGHTLTATPSGKGKITSVQFTNNLFTATGDIIGAGTYTYAPYSSVMALVQVNFTSGSQDGNTDYVTLEFTSAKGGVYVSAKQDSSVPGGWEYDLGSFRLSTTP